MLRVGQGKFNISSHNKHPNLHKQIPFSYTKFSPSFPSFSPSFSPPSQITSQINFSQKRYFEVHPFFQNAFRNTKKVIYHRFHNLFLPGQEKVKTHVYRIFNPHLYFDWRRHHRARVRNFKIKLHCKLKEHPLLYRFLRPYLQKKKYRLNRPKKKRRIKIYTAPRPERVQEWLPNRKRVLYDGIRRHPEYEEGLFHIKNLGHKYYLDKFNPPEDENYRKAVREYRKQPQKPRAGRFSYTNIKINKKDKTTALIEGYRTFESISTPRAFARFKHAFPKVISAWRALKQQFRRFKSKKYNWINYLDVHNHRFHPSAIKSYAHKCKKGIIRFLDKGDPVPLMKVLEPYELAPTEVLEPLIYDRQETIYGGSYSHPLALYGGFRRQQTIKTTRLRFKGFRYYEEEDLYIFYGKFRRLYTSLKRKYKLRKMRVYFQIIFNTETKRYYLRGFKLRYRRRRRGPLG